MSRATITNVDYYDCSAKPDGNYIHPTDCTRFIVCDAGKAHDVACPDCGKDNHPQCHGQEYLVFDDTEALWCDWPSTTPCGTNERPQACLLRGLLTRLGCRATARGTPSAPDELKA